MLDVKRLQVLLAIVEEGSVTGAATALGYTPSAVSQQLLRLEREAGQPLLDRHARGMTPTDAGLVLARHARKVVRQLAAAESDLADIAGVRRGSVTLGTFPTVGSSFLPLAVRRYRELYPAIQLTIHSGREDHLVQMLEEGRVALSLLWDYEWQRVDNDELVLTELFTDPTVLLVGATHRLARRRTVRMADLADEPWIIRAGGHPRRAPPSQAVRRPDQQHGGVGEQLGQDQLLVVDPLPLVVPQQGEGDPPLLEHLHEVVLAAAVDGQLDRGIELAVAADRQREERAPHGRERAEGDAAASYAGDVGQVGLRGRELAHDLAGVARQDEAGVGRRHPAGVAVEQRLSCLALEAQQLLGHGRGGVAQRRRGAGDRALLDDGQQDLEPLDVEHGSDCA